ncbi:hypothetical protein [Dactylosporangium darangshiense]|uniref:hypothetical protein n=1 Tax=Dactylosporangium darangshiense TaxID=579108 RepID=UPI00363567A8
MGPSVTDALAAAADAARLAPSVHNTQPWRWVVRGDTLELYAVPQRQLQEQDPDGRLMILSCGAALHHALVGLAAEGWEHRVERPAGEPLAVVHAERHAPADPHAMQRMQLLRVRHTDRRVVSDEPVPPDVRDALAEAARHGGARLHVLNRDQVLQLAVMIEHSGEAQRHDERMRAETDEWVGGDRPEGTGLPDAVIPAELPLTTVAERTSASPAPSRPAPGTTAPPPTRSCTATATSPATGSWPARPCRTCGCPRPSTARRCCR